MKVFMDDLTVEGDRFVFRWTLVGTNTGPGGTGKHVHISGFEEWRIALTASSQNRSATSTWPNTNGSSPMAPMNPRQCLA